MLLAEITWMGMGLIFLFGLAMFKCARGSCSRGPGFIGKALGVVAVLAGGWMLLMDHSHERPVNIDRDVAQDIAHEIDIENLTFTEHGPLGDNFNPLGDDFDPFAGHGGPFRVQSDSTPRVGMFVLLGVGLIILGAMLFGRDKQKPFALKALTWLGIGAIIFAVSSFFVVAPQADRVSHRPVSRAERIDEEQHAARRPSRPGRAKRPSMRPDRPSSVRSSREDEISLPPRAGSIPVEIEIAKAAARVKEANENAEKAKAESARAVEAAEKEAEIKQAEAEKAAESAEAAAAVKAEESKAATEAEVAEPAAPAEAPPTAEPAPAAKPVVVLTDLTPVAKPEPAPAPTAPPAIIVTSPANRPAWVTAGPALVEGVYRISVSSGPWSSVPECQHALDEEVLSAANNYINEYLGNPQAASLVKISPAYLRKNVLKTEHAETVDSPAVGQMHQLHAQLQFDEHARADFERMWRNAVVQDRLWYIGGGGALVLALLATLYGYLKLELRTDTASRGKLQLAATLVALIVAAGALLARWTVAF